MLFLVGQGCIIQSLAVSHSSHRGNGLVPRQWERQVEVAVQAPRVPIYTTVEGGQMLTARTVRILCGCQEETLAMQPGPQVTALQPWAHTVQSVKSTN